MSILSMPGFVTLALEIAVKSCVVLLAMLMLTWFLRRSSAATRHLYLSVGTVARAVCGWQPSEGDEPFGASSWRSHCSRERSKALMALRICAWGSSGRRAVEL